MHSTHKSAPDRQQLDQQFRQWGFPEGLASPLLAQHQGLFSDASVGISQATYDAMLGLIEAVEHVAQHPAYDAQARNAAPPAAQHRVPTHSAFMGYDFHVTPSAPKLIEINTNAGGALLNLLLFRAHSPAIPMPQIEAQIVAMFAEEWRLLNKGQRPLKTIAIVDNDPTQQFLYPEFVLFQYMFENAGLTSVIASPEEFHFDGTTLWHKDLAIDVVYNRSTDFYLEAPGSAALLAAYLHDAAVLSPHPQAHALLANKRNLISLSDDAWLSAIGIDAERRRILQQCIPRTIGVDPQRADTLWAARKGYFFKPVAGFGSKAAYRGDKLTKSTWADILQRDYIAQEFVPPSEQEVTWQGQNSSLKMDLRVYTYNGQPQMLTARLYQGQTTNLRTPGGGFAPIYLQK